MNPNGPNFEELCAQMENIHKLFESAEELREMLENDFLIALSVLMSCWARMKADEREMTMRLQEKWDGILVPLYRDWRKELQGEDDE